jgi:hypothetical protein
MPHCPPNFTAWFKEPPDAPAWFREQDRETLLALAALQRGRGDEGDRREMLWRFRQSLILRIKLFEEIVLPALREASTEASVVDQAEAEGQAMTEIILALEHADDDPQHPLLPELRHRFYRRMKIDEVELWPAAREAGADLVGIGDMLDWAWEKGTEAAGKI